jgi:hypothetical protein
VPLFAATAHGTIEVFPYGRDGRPMLRRSAEMEAMVVEIVDAVLGAKPLDAEGLMYVMHYLDQQGRVVPLYIGKAGRHGRSGAVVSANVASIRANAGRFARWGYNYAYHMGDLSAAALLGHPAAKVQRACFEVRFWCAAWGPGSPNIWREFGACPLAFAEYLLIGVAGLLFRNDLLNDEGVNRMTAEVQGESQ